MKLVDYIRMERGNATALAAALDISPSYLSQMASAVGVISPQRAVAIEAASGRKVRRWDCRPDDWHLIWPELVGSPGSPRIAKANRSQAPEKRAA